jgi:UDP-N-acetylglucosamine:LPS N-acetylglucosamine transferase
MFNLCIEAYKVLQETVPGLQMVLVCGPRIDPEELDLPTGVEAYGYVSNLIELFAASDLAVIQLGLSSAMELIALEKPFIYFPIPEHFEQDELAKRFKRRNIGVDMSVTSATAEGLAEEILDNLSKEVSYPVTSFDGAKNAAIAIKELITKR